MDHAWVGCRSVGDIQNPWVGDGPPLPLKPHSISMKGQIKTSTWKNRKGNINVCGLVEKSLCRMSLVKLFRFLVVELTHPVSNPKFDMDVTFIANYSFSGRRRPHRVALGD
jgi:hypothetical protein